MKTSYLFFMKDRFIRIAATTLLVLFMTSFSSFGQTAISAGTTMRVDAGTSVTSAEKFTINNGGTLNNEGTMIFKKSLENLNSAANSLGQGIVLFNGNSMSRTISGQNIIQDLTLNTTTYMNIDGLIAGGNTRVNGVLTLTHGIFYLGSYNLSLGPLASIAGTPASTSMVVATGTGQVQKVFTAAMTGNNFTFPVGDATGGLTMNYSPVNVGFNSGTFVPEGYVGVNLVDAQYPGTATSFLTRYWNITSSGITGFSANVNVKYPAVDVTGTESDIFLFKVAPVHPWTAYTAANTALHQLETLALPAFGIFTGNLGNGPVPPEIRSIQYKTIWPEYGNLCADATQTMLIAGNEGIYWVKPGGSVTHIAGQNIIYYPGTKVVSGGYLHGYISNTYCTPYNHNSPVQVAEATDDQASPANSGISENSQFRIYPNPTTDKFTIALSGDLPVSRVQVEISDLLGERILSQEMQIAGKQEFSLNGRPAGLYIVHITSGKISEIRKIIKH